MKIKELFNLDTEDYIFNYLQNESSLKNQMYYGELNEFKKQLHNIEWEKLYS